MGSGLGCLARLRVVGDASRATLALLKPIAVAVHLEDMDMMGNFYLKMALSKGAGGGV